MRERTRLEVEHARLGFLTPSHEFEVIGDTDSRYPVKDSFSIPFRFVCHLEIDYKKTRVKGGATGILISRRFVLTAAHNLETRTISAREGSLFRRLGTEIRIRSVRSRASTGESTHFGDVLTVPSTTV
jgi:V8-like Glu-specific endopeptidase